jgi:hemerythrin
MALITWNDSLSVGVKTIDNQHGVLVDTLNELHDAMMKGQAKNLTEPILRSLLAYTRNHFSAEEAMMAAARYPGLVEHRVKHRDLTKQVESYVERFHRGEITLNLHLMHFLRDWLTHHIQREDRAYGPCLTAHGMR